MKKLLIGLILVATGLIESTYTKANYVVASFCDQRIEYQLFYICYDYDVKGANYVGYSVNKEIVSAPVIKKRPGFHQERSVPKKFRMKVSDYTKSGYDKGHLAPNSALNIDLVRQKELFTMANIAPQVPGLNRGSWKRLEAYVVEEAYTNDLEVITGVCYTKYPQKMGKLTIPVGFFKIINYPGYHDEVYYMDNIKQSKPISDYRIYDINTINNKCVNITIIKHND